MFTQAELKYSNVELSHYNKSLKRFHSTLLEIIQIHTSENPEQHVNIFYDLHHMISFTGILRVEHTKLFIIKTN